ncbi:MAG: two-component regulator propeller domain-containing protein [Bacteroidota bacterium]
MKVLKTFIQFILLLAPIISKSQQVSFSPVPITVDRAFTNIVGMCQDKNGFIWLADNYNGLLKYDGSRLVSYKSNPRNSNSLISDNLECLFAGSNGNIWIGSKQNGLDSFEPEAETFTHFQHNEADPTSLSSNAINAILEDRSGTLWVGTNNGLDTLNRKTGKFTHITNNSEAGLALNHEDIKVIYEDKEGTIWIGSGNTFGIQNSQLHGLYKFEKKSSKIARFQHNEKVENSLIDNKVRAIFEDSRGVFWIGTAGDGLHIMDRKNGTFQRCLFDPQKPEKLSRPLVNIHALYAVDHIAFINEDMQGCIWIGTYAAGINRYNPKTKKIEHFGTKEKDSYKLDKDDFWGMLKTKDNLMWVSGWEPVNENQVLYKISTLLKQINYTHLGKEVTTFSQDAEGNMWLGTKQGILKKSNRDSIFRNVNNVITKNYLGYLKHDSLNNLWISTDNGLYYENNFTKNIINYRHDEKNTNSLASNTVFLTEQIGNGHLLVGTNQGLDLLNTHTGIFKHFTHNPNDSSSISGNRITSIKKDKSGNIWVGTTKGLNLFDPKTEKFSSSLDINGSTIYFIFVDSRNKVWVSGYRSGLYVYDQQSPNFLPFSDSTGLISNNLLIRGITEDNEHSLWMNTDIGIIKLNPETKSAVLFGKSHGIDPKIIKGTGFTASNGEIFYGASAGYYQFKPQNFVKKMEISPPLFSKFFVNNTELISGNNKILQKPLSQTKKITLNYNQNNFAIEFNNIDFITLEDEKNLLYKLENFDEAWRKSSSEKKAYYYSVSPGKYVFRVKALNGNGIWAEKSITINISPPFWNTWWFILIAIILAISTLYILIRWRIYDKFNKQLVFSEKEKKLAELQQEKVELEMQVLRAQMNPHFIFNSLNSINRFILQNNSTLASEYLTKFSRLVRMILQNSQANLISLESELDSLKLYLELEALRFNYHFTYKITIPKELDIEILKIPPLIIQPFAENAIWHGLMHKEEKGLLDIEISQENEHLFFKITDDGIGRKASASSSSKTASMHKSMGMAITANRISMMQNLNGMASSVTIIDMMDNEGKGAGTEVIIKIPVIYD